MNILQYTTLSNGRDYVLRTRKFDLQTGGHDPEDCDMRLTWAEFTVITHGGKTTQVDRASDGWSEVQRDTDTSPWNLERDLGAYPDRVTEANGLVLRCAVPGRDGPRVPLPIIDAKRLCVTERPAVFRDQFGKSLLMAYEGRGQVFGGKGGLFTVTSRPSGYRTRPATTATWDPTTYLRD